MVLRGFELYWYQEIDSKEHKGISPIPSKEIGSIMVENKKCFVLEKCDNVKESRRLVFLDTDQMQHFKMQVTIMSNLKRYIEQVIAANENIQPAIVEYLKALHLTEISFNDVKLEEKY